MDQDYKELIEFLDKKFLDVATKEDLNNLSVKLVLREEFDQFGVEMKNDLDGLREAVQALSVSVDKYAQKADTFFQEMVMLSHKVDRHEKWLMQLAQKLDIKLDY